MKGKLGYEKETAITFPMQSSRGFEMDKKLKKWVDEWQKLPYISPYENASHLPPKSDESDKWGPTSGSRGAPMVLNMLTNSPNNEPLQNLVRILTTGLKYRVKYEFKNKGHLGHLIWANSMWKALRGNFRMFKR
ncbi:hypothetical protein CJ030_MR3G009457 [Morella rubra]|uniref:PORR domain-containing protein n=1 Tax=Morella rubra TaxID=262757 RepID=A0A6A1W3X2_9ROSI|nr:hypothetical protein CJ030_MR3G009457 [Morella rubra]